MEIGSVGDFQKDQGGQNKNKKLPWVNIDETV